ncbi:MAG: hypothetical protein FD151_1094 [bacterium]|nr:MAG: hypothetical protein FD151_1094 [bacterium]
MRDHTKLRAFELADKVAVRRTGCSLLVCRRLLGYYRLIAYSLST